MLLFYAAGVFLVGLDRHRIQPGRIKKIPPRKVSAILR